MNDEDRTDSTLTGSEREQVESFLHDNRFESVGLLDGLTEEQARRRLVPSLTTRLGLVKHAAFAQRVWFDVSLDVSLAGRMWAVIGLPAAVEHRLILTDDDTIKSVLAQYRRAWTNADETAAVYSLNDRDAQPPRTTAGALDLRAHDRGTHGTPEAATSSGSRSWLPVAQGPELLPRTAPFLRMSAGQFSSD